MTDFIERMLDQTTTAAKEAATEARVQLVAQGVGEITTPSVAIYDWAEEPEAAVGPSDNQAGA